MSDRDTDLWDRLFIPKRIVWLDVDADLVLFNSANGSYSILNEVASSIWRNISCGRSFACTMERLTDEYHADRESIAGDLIRFMHEAVQSGILEHGIGGDA